MEMHRKIVVGSLLSGVVVGLVGSVIFVRVMLAPSSKAEPDLTWTDVQLGLQGIKSVSYRLSMKTAGMPDWEIAGTHMQVMPGLIRVDVERPEKMTVIGDLTAKKTLCLYESRKEAIVMPLDSLTQAQHDLMKQGDFLSQLKRFADAQPTDAGIRKIQGRLVKGFRIADAQPAWTVWVDVESGLPVAAEAGSPEGTMAITDIRVNEEMDESLFSLDLPAGYTLQESPMPIVEDMVAFLRSWASKRGGGFPATLDKESMFELFGELSVASEAGQEESKTASRVFRAMMLLEMHPSARYAGKGVKLGDGTKPIFWYKPAKDSQAYRVIYGDLSVKDVPTDELPEGTQGKK